VDAWLAEAPAGDVALDVFVPGRVREAVMSRLRSRGRMVVELDWSRVGLRPQDGDACAELSGQFYLSLCQHPGESAGAVADRGHVDDAEVSGGLLRVRGWAIAADGSAVASIALQSGPDAAIAPALRVRRQLRPDVQASFGLAHALVGFVAEFELPEPPATGATAPAHVVAGTSGLRLLASQQASALLTSVPGLRQADGAGR
jgi:hypothetical protein